MPGLVVLESMWNRKGQLLEDEPSVLPYLKAIKQSLAWEGIRVNLVYRRFYSNYDLGLLLEEVRRPRSSFKVCYIASHGKRRTLMGIGNRVIRLSALVEHCRLSRRIGYIFGACDIVTPGTAPDVRALAHPPAPGAGGLRDHPLREPAEGLRPSLPGFPAGPRHHLLVLHARPPIGPTAAARELLRRLPAEPGSRPPPRPRPVARGYTDPACHHPHPGGTNGRDEGVRESVLPGGGPRPQDHAARGAGRPGGGRLHVLSARTLRGCEGSRGHRRRAERGRRLRPARR